LPLPNAFTWKKKGGMGVGKSKPGARESVANQAVLILFCNYSPFFFLHFYKKKIYLAPEGVSVLRSVLELAGQALLWRFEKARFHA
jgi:hypothetical protein